MLTAGPRRRDVAVRLGRLLLSGPLQVAAAGLATRAAPQLATAADHERVRAASHAATVVVRAAEDASSDADAPRTFTPPPNSQLCGGMAFSMSLFFPGRAIDPALLEPALRGVLSELPHLAGRGATLGSGSRLADTVLRCSNAGVELATAAAPAVRLQDVGPHTWSSYNADRPPGALPLPFYAQPLNAAASMAGRAPPVGLRLTDLADGQVLNLGFWHVVADAGRGLSLAGRLADHYRALCDATPVPGEPLTADTRFDSPLRLMEHLSAKPPSWEPQPLDGRLSPLEWLGAPAKLAQSLRSRHDVHLLYLPRTVAQRVKEAAQARAGSGVRLSTNDAAQGLLHTLVADIRGMPLTPGPGQYHVAMMDLMHEGLGLRDPGAAARFFGNSVQVVKLHGMPADAGLQGLNGEARFDAAAALNALRVRQGITAFKAGPAGVLDSVEEHGQMARMHKLRLGLTVAVKDRSNATTSSVTKFPTDTLDFGGGGPCYLQWEQASMGTGFDRYCVLTPALGVDDGRGVLVRMVLAPGMGGRLREHAVWRGLLQGAQLVAAGEQAAPLGSTAS